MENEAYRFPRRDDYARNLPIETALLDLFYSQSPVLVPKLKLHHSPDGKPYVTYRFIPGLPFMRDKSKTFSETELLEIARQLGGFLTALHSFPLDKAKEIGIKELNTFNDWKNRFIKIKNEVYPHITEKQQKWINQIFTDFLDLVKMNPPQTRLTHSDIEPEHIIINPETHELTGIIDFGDACITDPAYDFTFLHKYGQNFLDAAYNSYKLDRDETFEKRRQFYEDRLVATNLEHSIEHQDKEKIDLHKKQLAEYVSKFG